jgi:NlpC/P60 family putative phage cell wall peptidase
MSAPAHANPEAVVAAALSWLDTPYHHQASKKGVGCDCLGLARGVWREVVGPEPLDPWGGRVPAYTRDVGESSGREVLADAARAIGMIELPVENAVAAKVLPAGALALFRMTPRAIAKHCGILIGGGLMVHSLSRHRVMRAAYDAIWARRVAYAFLYPRPLEGEAEAG